MFRRPVGPSGCGRIVVPLGDVAQLVERLLCKQEVDGSIPFVSTVSGWSEILCLFHSIRKGAKH